MVFKFLKFRRNTSESAMELIMGWGSTVSGKTKEGRILNGERSKFEQYLQAVGEIQRQIESATTSKDQLRKANVAMKIAMVELENQFRVTLISLTSQTGASKTNKSSTGSSSKTDSTLSYGDYDCAELNTKKEDDLRNIAKRMNSAGALHKCVEIYKSVRKTFLDGSYRILGMQNASINDIRSLDWEALEVNIERWILVAKICVRSLFAREKTLCEQIFGGLGTLIYDACLAEVVRDPATQLLASGEAIIKCTSSPARRPEKLFKILDLHESMSELVHNFNIIFQSKSFELFRIQAAEMLMQLTEAPREILSEFVTTMLHEQSYILDYRGNTDSLTTYVMSYITRVTHYEKMLTKLILSKPSKLEARRGTSSGVLTIPDMDFPELDELTPLVVHLIWIIEILQFKLEAKSKGFEDASLAQLFIINNLHYIVQGIEDCLKLQEMVGGYYLVKLTKNFERAVMGYQRSTWDGIFHCFRDKGLYTNGNLFSGLSKSVLKEKLKTFNVMFEKVLRIQPTWLVPDVYPREKLRSSISELIPAYRYFLEVFKRYIRSASHHREYIKYSVEDLEVVISNFFPSTIESDTICPPPKLPSPHLIESVTICPLQKVLSCNIFNSMRDKSQCRSNLQNII